MATAEQVKAALYSRHPAVNRSVGNGTGIPDQWVCLEEYLNIDLLALSAWRDQSVVGYEVKVSRNDMRSELLNPSKRAIAVSRCTQFYFAVPKGLLRPEEIAWEEPEWEPADFERVPCPGVLRWGQGHRSGGRLLYGGPCRKNTGKWRDRSMPSVALVDVPWASWAPDREHQQIIWDHGHSDYSLKQGVMKAVCPTCEGKGHIGQSRVELESPTIWIPRDVGLVEVDINRHTSITVREAPKRKDADVLADSRYTIAQLVRHASFKPDPRHASRLKRIWESRALS